ncbi:MAG: hypothetical protein OHK0019_22870 [Saprospiraceae bacterium]
MKNRLNLLRISLLLPVFLLSSCIFYQRYPMAKSRLTKIGRYQLTFYVLDASRPSTHVWYVSEADFQDDKMVGVLVRLDEVEAEEVATVTGRRDARLSKDEVLMYVKPQFTIALSDSATVTLNYDQLEKIEVYEVNHTRTLFLSLLAGLMPILLLGGISGG